MERSSKHGPRLDDELSAPTDEVELRSELAKRLRRSAFPADRTALEQVAVDEQAPGYILDLIRRLPDGETYQNTQDVWAALNGREESRF